MPAEINYIVVGLTSILFLIILDVISAVAVHLHKGDFDYRKLLDFLKTNIVPYVLIWGALAGIPYLLEYVEISSDVLVYFEGGVGVVWMLIVGKLITSIYKNFSELGIDLSKKK